MEEKSDVSTDDDDTTKKKVSPSNDNEIDEIPPDIAEYKTKLEAKTGKKYKYRPAKKDLPSIQHMLAHGAPESAGRPKTWMELIGYPFILAILFIVTLHLFLTFVPPGDPHKFTLPAQRHGGAGAHHHSPLQQQQQQQQQQQCHQQESQQQKEEERVDEVKDQEL